MYLLTEQSINILQPVEYVFNYVANMENFSNWFPEVIAIKSIDNLENRQVGKRYLETVYDPFKGKSDIVIQVTKVEQNKIFMTEGAYPPLLPKMEIVFNKLNENSCIIIWRMFSRNNNPLIKATLLQLVKRVIRKRAAKGLVKLKNELEDK